MREKIVFLFFKLPKNLVFSTAQESRYSLPVRVITRDFFLLLFTSIKNAMLYATKNRKNALIMLFKATKMLFKPKKCQKN